MKIKKKEIESKKVYRQEMCSESKNTVNLNFLKIISVVSLAWNNSLR